MYQNMAILVAFIFLYSLSSGAIERKPISGAIIFIAFGLIFGPVGRSLPPRCTISTLSLFICRLEQRYQYR